MSNPELFGEVCPWEIPDEKNQKKKSLCHLLKNKFGPFNFSSSLIFSVIQHVRSAWITIQAIVFDFKKIDFILGEILDAFGSRYFNRFFPLCRKSWLPRNFPLGVGITYPIFHMNRRYIGGESSLYGGRLFSKDIMCLPQTSFLPLNMNRYQILQFNLISRIVFEAKSWSNALFSLEGGILCPFWPRGGANFTFLYNVAHNNLRSPYWWTLCDSSGVLYCIKPSTTFSWTPLFQNSFSLIKSVRIVTSPKSN